MVTTKLAPFLTLASAQAAYRLQEKAVAAIGRENVVWLAVALRKLTSLGAECSRLELS